MQAAGEWIGDIASFLTIASFVCSLSISRRICRATSSTDVAFSPLVVGILCTLFWLLYGHDIGDARVKLVGAFGLIVTTVNATMHRVFAEGAYPGSPLAAVLLLMYHVPSMMETEQLGKVAFIFSVAYHLVPVIPSVTMFTRLQISLWKIVIFGLWTVYGGLVDDPPLFTSSLIGFSAGVIEFALRSTRPPPDSLRQELQ
ncbi:sugar transporter SWEET1 [Rhipicephalus microplus]|uniref:Putative sugar transporter sweet n=1 Tax=Rhipicephalus microplus TaxID=6941 RepID=A0A6M2D651_RHIMP